MIGKYVKIQKPTGWVILAIPTDQIDYVELAKTLCRNIKQTQKIKDVCLLTDRTTAQSRNLTEFDIVHELFEIDWAKNNYAYDWQSWCLSPYRETIKIECDIFLNRDITHWINLMRHKSVCFMEHCRTIDGNLNNDQQLRPFLGNHSLTNAYNGICYFRLDQESQKFFDTVRLVFFHWQNLRRLWQELPEYPATDEVYSLAEMISGVRAHIPLSQMQFVHAKSQLHNYYGSLFDNCHVQWHNHNHVSINGISQKYPIHLPDIKNHAELYTGSEFYPAREEK